MMLGQRAQVGNPQVGGGCPVRASWALCALIARPRLTPLVVVAKHASRFQYARPRSCRFEPESADQIAEGTDEEDCVGVDALASEREDGSRWRFNGRDRFLADSSGEGSDIGMWSGTADVGVERETSLWVEISCQRNDYLVAIPAEDLK
jgi:hypothetical protein